MSGAKPWQIALVVVGLLAGVVGLVFALGSMGPVETAERVYVADVTTGELYTANTAGKKTVLIPMTNPDSGENTLYPVVEDEETGEWTISGRYRDAFLKRTDGEPTPAVDRDTGIVTVSGSPRSL